MYLFGSFSSTGDFALLRFWSPLAKANLSSFILDVSKEELLPDDGRGDREAKTLSFSLMKEPGVIETLHSS